MLAMVGVAVILAEPAATPSMVTLQLVVVLDKAQDEGLTVATPVLLEASVTFTDTPPVRVRVTRRDTADVMATCVVLNDNVGDDELELPPPHPPINDTVVSPITNKR